MLYWVYTRHNDASRYCKKKEKKKSGRSSNILSVLWARNYNVQFDRIRRKQQQGLREAESCRDSRDWCVQRRREWEREEEENRMPLFCFPFFLPPRATAVPRARSNWFPTRQSQQTQARTHCTCTHFFLSQCEMMDCTSAICTQRTLIPLPPSSLLTKKKNHTHTHTLAASCLRIIVSWLVLSQFAASSFYFSSLRYKIQFLPNLQPIKHSFP